MALTEEKVLDKIEIVESGDVQVRHVTRINRDGETIAQNYHRCTLSIDLLEAEVEALRLAVEALCAEE